MANNLKKIWKFSTAKYSIHVHNLLAWVTVTWAISINNYWYCGNAVIHCTHSLGSVCTVKQYSSPRPLPLAASFSSLCLSSSSSTHSSTPTLPQPLIGLSTKSTGKGALKTILRESAIYLQLVYLANAPTLRSTACLAACRDGGSR